MSNTYRFTKQLAQELLNSLNGNIARGYPNFVAFLESMCDESKHLKTHDTSERKQSKGHSTIYSLYKELYPNVRIEENVTMPIEIEGSRITVEFDVVNFGHKVIFEIQGEHHRKFVPHFHKTPEAFARQRKRDVAKVQWAEDNGWTLIQIDDKRAKSLDSIEQLAIIINEAQCNESTLSS